ncbi:type II toxin-antitoxin system VapC family toxin [Streptomyces sp. NPDC048254]|uniref:type II toxin-antitoxin system VapC family toxin n=1 Tax=Streptomyces sp. NPDC048254 TaxID=3365525 RepID=UPI00371063B0
MIYLFDTNVVAELTTRAKPDPRVLSWFRSTARPNRFLSVITVAEIEAGVAATPDPVRQARYAQALAVVRHEYRDRIAPIGEPEAAAYLTIHKTLKAAAPALTRRTP